MNREVACIIIAHERRRELLRERVWPSVIAQDFNEIVVVGDWPELEPDDAWYPARYLCVAPLLGTTTDSLVKRDAGTLATHADTLVYLHDDHALAPHFLTELREVIGERWDVLVPNRITIREGEPIALNNGEHDGYCGGHGGVFRRHVVAACPWSAGPHDRLWDANMSAKQLHEQHAIFVWKPRAHIAIIDVEPGATPWR